MTLRVLRRFRELTLGQRETIGVFEDRSEGVVIFLPAPRDTDYGGHDSLQGRSDNPTVPKGPAGVIPPAHLIPIPSAEDRELATRRDHASP